MKIKIITECSWLFMIVHDCSWLFRAIIMPSPIRCWECSWLHSQQFIPTQHDMLPQHHVYRNELNCECYNITLARRSIAPWWWSKKIEICWSDFKCFYVEFIYKCNCWLITEVKLINKIIIFILKIYKIKKNFSHFYRIYTWRRVCCQFSGRLPSHRHIYTCLYLILFSTMLYILCPSGSYGSRLQEVRLKLHSWDTKRLRDSIFNLCLFFAH